MRGVELPSYCLNGYLLARKQPLYEGDGTQTLVVSQVERNRVFRGYTPRTLPVACCSASGDGPTTPAGRASRCTCRLVRPVNGGCASACAGRADCRRRSMVRRSRSAPRTNGSAYSRSTTFQRRCRWRGRQSAATPPRIPLSTHRGRDSLAFVATASGSPLSSMTK